MKSEKLCMSQPLFFLVDLDKYIYQWITIYVFLQYLSWLNTETYWCWEFQLIWSGIFYFFLQKVLIRFCEKSIFTECKFGWFGPHCESRCNKNCGVPGRCDWITGQCEGGCQAGWEIPECDKSKKKSNFMWKSKLHIRDPTRKVTCFVYCKHRYILI